MKHLGYGMIVGLAAALIVLVNPTKEEPAKVMRIESGPPVTNDNLSVWLETNTLGKIIVHVDTPGWRFSTNTGWNVFPLAMEPMPSFTNAAISQMDAAFEFVTAEAVRAIQISFGNGMKLGWNLAQRGATSVDIERLSRAAASNDLETVSQWLKEHP